MKITNKINSIIPKGEALVILNNIRSLDFTIVSSKKLTKDETIFVLGYFIKLHREAFDADKEKFLKELRDISEWLSSSGSAGDSGSPESQEDLDRS